MGAFKKDKESSFDFLLWSLATEIGIQGILSGDQSVEILAGFDLPMSGKARFSYFPKETGAGDRRQITLNDAVKSGWRTGLSGRYSFGLAGPLRCGAQVSGFMGNLKFAERKEATFLQGIGLFGFLLLEIQ